MLERQIHQLLGLGPGDEHAGPDLQAQVAEIGPAADVGHRLVRGPPGDESPVGGHLLRSQRAVVLGIQIDALEPQSLGQE